MMKLAAQMKSKFFRIHSDFLLSHLLMAALLAAFLTLVFGYMLRLTHSGDWALPAGALMSVSSLHRALAWISASLLGISAALIRFRYHRYKWVSMPLYLSASLAFILAPASALQDPFTTALRLAVLGLGLVSLNGWLQQRNTEKAARSPSLSSPFSKLALAALSAVFVLMVSGAVVSLLNANQACTGWPLCSGGLPADSLGWLALTHRIITLLTGLMITMMFVHAWRSQRSQQVILTAATVALVLFVGVILIGAVMSVRAGAADLAWLHAISAVALWASLVIVVAAAAFAARSAQEEADEAAQPLPVDRRLKDFLILSKPIIVLLLLVTTYAGMVVGGKGIPALALTFWTMLGGALAAGGSSAINQFIDREIDKAMQRTAKRPLPDGRLTPAEGLAYGAGAVMLAFFLLAAFVNLLAALLSLAGAIYYVLIYSIWLKRATVQNIVIGGGAGAIPPLVGWAAASGSLNIPALFLFAIVFLWTPPHFWALALVRRKDYARVGVPMLPVVQGEHAARKQIFIYTLELVALTLLMPFFKITGSVFLISAAVLGFWLIYSAWKVLRDGGNKVAWKMYRHSSMYLAFLFLALVLDVLV